MYGEVKNISLSLDRYSKLKLGEDATCIEDFISFLHFSCFFSIYAETFSQYFA